MVQITNQQLQRIDYSCSKVLAGEICHIIEEFQNSKKNMNDVSIVILLKNLLKNKIYESGRIRTAMVEEFSNGLTHFNVEFAKPTDKV